ncbi:hypothetical protein Tco_0856092, partial [Tanacetum coccineum]
MAINATTFALISGDIIPISSTTCRQGILSPWTCHQGIHAGEFSKGIQAPAIFPGDNDGPTLFSVSINVGLSNVFPGDMS